MPERPGAGIDERPVLSVRDLHVTYRSSRGDGAGRARGVASTCTRARRSGVAGESGCGKSTMAMALLRLLPASTRTEGQILLDGEDVLAMKPGRLRAVRWSGASIVFQGAQHALNPVQRIGEQITEAITTHKIKGTTAGSLLELVGLPTRRTDDYPHELSGGQKQRVMIAMALACDPRLLIADEPTTALDVMVQAQVLALLERIQAERGLATVFITHDLSVLSAVAQRLVVMYAGRIVEEGPAEALLTDPQHPYTRALSGAFPTIGDPASRFAPVRAPRRSARPVRGAGRMFVPSPLPRGLRGLRGDRGGAAAGGRRRSTGRLPARVGAGGGGVMSATPMAVADRAAPLLSLRDVQVHYPPRRRGGTVARAVDGVDLEVRQGEVLALVGESGCGKTTLARAVLGLQPLTGGRDLLRRPGHGPVACRPAGLAPPGPAGLPGPDRLAQPAPDDLRDRGRGSPHPRPAERARPGGRDPGPVRSAAAGALLPALPPRAVRRAAAAGGDRRRDGDGAEAAGGRRTGLQPRRLGARGDPAPAPGSGPEGGRHRPRRDPRPGFGLEHRRSDRRDVPGAHRGDRPHGRDPGRPRSTRTPGRCCRWCPKPSSWSRRS